MARRAFTAVEALLSLGVIAISAGVAVPVIRNVQIRNDLNVTTSYVEQALRTAQSNARAGKNTGVWGAELLEGVVYEGVSYGQRVVDSDEAYPLSPAVDISGLTDVVFEAISGRPLMTGEIILTALNGDQRIITVSDQGLISVTAIASGFLGGGGGDDDGETGAGGADGPGETAGTTGTTSTTGTDGTAGGTTGTSGDSGDTGTTGDAGTTGDTGATGTAGDASSSGETASDGSTSSDDDSTGDDAGQSSSGASSSSSQEGGSTLCQDRFQVGIDGGIVTTGRVSATVRALGSQITYGAGGPTVNVAVQWSTDGRTWANLFGGSSIRGGESETIADLQTGTKLRFRINGSYSFFFNRSYVTTDGTGHIEVLQNGERPPSYPAFNNQGSLQSFLSEIIDDNGRISIGEYDAVLIAELGDLGSSSADFQDAVLLVSFAQEPNSCAAAASSSSSSQGAVNSDGSSSSTGAESSSVSSERKIMVCHFVDGQNPTTIEIGESAWSAHATHGDHKGVCDEDDDGDEIANSLDLCPGTRVDNPRQYLLFFRYSLTDQNSDIFRVGPQKKIGEFDLDDTMGCSCEQILDVAEGRGEHYFTTLPKLYLQLRNLLDFYLSTARKFGCGKDLLRLIEKNKN